MKFYNYIRLFFLSTVLLVSNLIYGSGGKVLTVYENGVSGVIEDTKTGELIQFIEPGLESKKIVEGDHVVFFKLAFPDEKLLAIEFVKDNHPIDNKKEVNFSNSPFFSPDGKLIVIEGEEFRTSAGTLVYKDDAINYTTKTGIYHMDDKGMISFYTNSQIATKDHSTAGTLNTP